MKTTNRALKRQEEQTTKIEAYINGSYVDKNYRWAYLIVENNTTILYEDSGIGENKDACIMNDVAGELSAAMRAANWARINNVSITIIYNYSGVSAWLEEASPNHFEYAKVYSGYMKDIYDKGYINFRSKEEGATIEY